MPAKDSHNGVSLVHHHPDYYLKDGNITFLVRYTFFFYLARADQHMGAGPGYTFSRASPLFRNRVAIFHEGIRKGSPGGIL